MKIKNLNLILKDILNNSKKTPGEWKAIMASTQDNTGRDMLIFHPTEGPIYQLKSYEKNPYQVEGYGMQISKDVDKEFLNLIKSKKSTGNVGIVDLNLQIIRETLKEGVSIDKLFFNAISGRKNQGIGFLNLGNSYGKNKPIPLLTEEQKELNREYNKLVKRSGQLRMYG